MGYAGRQIRLSMPQEDGKPLLDHLMADFRQTGNKHEMLEEVECPIEIKYIWEYWLMLHRRRPADGPITYHEILSWSMLRGIRLTPFEVEALDHVESLYWKIKAEK